MKTVQGKRVLVTGAASGLGRLFAQRAAAEGAATVVLWDVDEAGLKETEAGLPRTGHTHVRRDVVDLRDRSAIEEAAAGVRTAEGAPHVVINNAGVVRGNAYFWETDNAADTELTMRINALAPMFVTREFLPGMIASGEESRLVTLASAAGLTSNPRMASYCGSKWAAVGFSDSVRLELEQAGHDHVKVTTVCPYYIKTGMFDGAKAAPMLPLLEPEDVVADVWKAMKRGRPLVVRPRSVLLSEAMKGVLPTRTRDFLGGRVIGVHRSMEEFTGRR